MCLCKVSFPRGINYDLYRVHWSSCDTCELSVAKMEMSWLITTLSSSFFTDVQSMCAIHVAIIRAFPRERDPFCYCSYAFCLIPQIYGFDSSCLALLAQWTKNHFIKKHMTLFTLGDPKMHLESLRLEYSSWVFWLQVLYDPTRGIKEAQNIRSWSSLTEVSWSHILWEWSPKSIQNSCLNEQSFGKCNTQKHLECSSEMTLDKAKIPPDSWLHASVH